MNESNGAVNFTHQPMLHESITGGELPPRALTMEKNSHALTRTQSGRQSQGKDIDVSESDDA